MVKIKRSFRYHSVVTDIWIYIRKNRNRPTIIIRPPLLTDAEIGRDNGESWVRCGRRCTFRRINDEFAVIVTDRWLTVVAFPIKASRNLYPRRCSKFVPRAVVSTRIYLTHVVPGTPDRTPEISRGPPNRAVAAFTVERETQSSIIRVAREGKPGAIMCARARMYNKNKRRRRRRFRVRVTRSVIFERRRRRSSRQ